MTNIGSVHNTTRKFITESDSIIASQPSPGAAIEFRDKPVLVIATAPDCVLVLDGIKMVKITSMTKYTQFLAVAQQPRRGGYTVAEHAQSLQHNNDMIIVDYLDIMQ